MNLLVMLHTMLTLLGLTSAAVLDKTFYVIVNTPQIDKHQENVYLYAISKNGVTDGDEIKFTKNGDLPGNTVQTGIIESDNLQWGCYLKLGTPTRYNRARVGTYEAEYINDNGPNINRHALIKPKSRILNTRGIYTVTVYPEVSGLDRLAGDNSIGVVWSPGCLVIKWCKGRRRNINTGPRLTLTSTKDAGIYSITRPKRGKRGWSVQIQVIVASCQEDEYLSGEACITRSVLSCDNGGVLKDAADECLYPPYFTDFTCATEFCPDGWLAYNDIDHRCYRTFTDDMDFASYENFCQSQGGHLASFHTQEELAGVTAALSGGFDYWFGLNDRDTEGQFCYTDNSRVDISNWNPGQPNNFGGNEDCAELRSAISFNWNDDSCSLLGRGICMQVPCSSFVLGQDAGATLRCEDLKGGNPTCRGFLVCLGDLYGCKCASGWYGNNCDRPCPHGRWGPGCELDCPETNSNCNRFTGPAQ